MEKIQLTQTITVPDGMTAEEIVRLFTDHHNYQETVPEVVDGLPTGNRLPNPVSRAGFAKATLARQIKEAIKAQRRKEAEDALSIDDITVE